MLLDLEVAVVVRLQKQRIQINVQEHREDSIVADDLACFVELDVLIQRE